MGDRHPADHTLIRDQPDRDGDQTAEQLRSEARPQEPRHLERARWAGTGLREWLLRNAIRIAATYIMSI